MDADTHSVAQRRLDGGDVDLHHGHHRVEGPSGLGRVRVGDGVHQHGRRDLPGDAPAVPAPAAGDALAAVVHQGVPVAVSLGLVGGGHLERKRVGVRMPRTAIQAQAGHAQHGEFHRQHIALSASRVVGRRAVHRRHGRIGEHRRIKPRRLFGVAVTRCFGRAGSWTAPVGRKLPAIATNRIANYHHIALGMDSFHQKIRPTRGFTASESCSRWSGGLPGRGGRPAPGPAGSAVRCGSSPGRFAPRQTGRRPWPGWLRGW